ncbi:MAG: hypothetical protein PF508_19380 [Spirochaeta sp.]|nr:hypothetical protein [Spirochaeta sp.]
MIRRVSVLFTVCLLLFAFSHNLVAQVYPDREELDVVRLVDGTILKGVILEQVPDRYLEIELYGGSTFVLGYEQIESVEREANPDYGTTWIKIELGAGSGGGGEADGSDEASGTGAADGALPAADDRPFLGQGWLVGVHGVFGMSGTLPGHTDGLSGKDWDAVTEDLQADDSQLLGTYGGHIGGGLFGAFLRPWETGEADRYLWGVRGGIGYYYGNRSFGSDYVDNISSDGRHIFQDILFFDIPAEGLIGIGGPRAFVYLSAGFSLSIITSPPDDSWGNDPAIYDFPEFDNPVNPGVIGSVGTMFRLGSNWTGEFRVFFQRQLTSWYSDFEQYYNQAPGFSLGAAYHRKR